MRVLLLTTHLNIGGIGTYTVSLAKALKSKKVDVYVASSGGVLVAELVASGISHITMDISTKNELSPKVFKGCRELCRIVRRLDINIIHAQTRVTQVLGFFVAKLCNIGFVTTCHGFFRKNIGRILLPAWGERVIAISEAVQAQLDDAFKVDKKKIALIYNGIDVQRFIRDCSEEEKDAVRNKYNIKKYCLVLGSISRFTPDKGHDVLLYGLVEILKKNPKTQLVLTGDGKEYEKITDLISYLKLEDNVVLIKPKINTFNILSVIDIFMFAPKRKEGLGIVLLEALAAGKPVVATNVGGISTVIENGVNGFLVEPCKHKGLVEPVMRLAEDRELYKRISQAGREIVLKRFSIDGMVDKVYSLYEDILSERKK